MDRFKYRVWDKERKCFFNDDEVVIYPNGEESFFNADYDFIECVVEQCTGLKDKNGKLIYEGDVIKIYAKNRYAYGIFQIKYDCDDCEYDMLDEEGNFIYQLQNDKTKYVEVIGNIHTENVDLLGEDR